MSSFKDTIYSAVKNKCPNCHKGKVFENNNPYSFKNGLTMNKNCPECGSKYEKETGFFYGAMYVSYALQVAMFVTLFTLNYLFFNLDSGVLLAIIIVFIVGLFPITFRSSRIIWLSMFTHSNVKRTKSLKGPSAL
jgi:uncharacterized protein (DUF983 family)